MTRFYRLAVVALLSCLFVVTAGSIHASDPFLVDGDADGVPFADDLCPYTPRGISVDDTGCEMPLDTDGDGVLDNEDVCPVSPEKSIVDRQGCAIDSDFDGVADGLDTCPKTPFDSAVDRAGCPLRKSRDGAAAKPAARVIPIVRENVPARYRPRELPPETVVEQSAQPPLAPVQSVPVQSAPVVTAPVHHATPRIDYGTGLNPVAINKSTRMAGRKRPSLRTTNDDSSSSSVQVAEPRATAQVTPPTEPTAAPPKLAPAPVSAPAQSAPKTSEPRTAASATRYLSVTAPTVVYSTTGADTIVGSPKIYAPKEASPQPAAVPLKPPVVAAEQSDAAPAEMSIAAAAPVSRQSIPIRKPGVSYRIAMDPPIVVAKTATSASAFVDQPAPRFYDPAPATSSYGSLLEKVNFRRGQSALGNYSKTLLKRAVARMRANLARDPGTRFLVAGHSDGKGAAAENEQIARKRATVVRDYLVSAGIPAKSLTVTSFGFQKPLSTSGSVSADARNRRVEIRVR